MRIECAMVLRRDNSPVVTSTPLVMKFSGCPGVWAPHWRKDLMSSICEVLQMRLLVGSDRHKIRRHLHLILAQATMQTLYITHRDAVIASEMEHSILEHGAMTSREHKAVPVQPIRILGIILHGLVPEDIAHRSTAHGHSRMAGLGLVDGIDGNETNSVDALVLEFPGDGGGGNSLGHNAHRGWTRNACNSGLLGLDASDSLLGVLQHHFRARVKEIQNLCSDDNPPLRMPLLLQQP